MRVLSMNSDLLKQSFVWHLAKVKASYFTASLATGNFIDFVVWGLWFLEEGEGHTQPHTMPTLHTTMRFRSLLITHSFPPCTQSYLHSPVSQVTGLHSVAHIQHYIPHIRKSMQSHIINPQRRNHAGFCFILGSVQPISRIFRRRANLFPPLVPDSTSVCQLLKQESLKC